VGDEDALPAFALDVLDVVAAIPAGAVLTYGDVAELLGQGGPRSVARVLSRYGGSVPWWRVLRADGSPAPQVARRALEHYRDEGTPLRAYGTRVDMGRARWDGRSPGAVGPL
jgi:alkylated DNA nucleotide flippase Atl1